jgi:hypothetical protein
LIPGPLAVLPVAVLLAVTATVYLLTLPGVGDAGARVDAILAHHGGHASSLPPPRRPTVAASPGPWKRSASA